MIVEEKIYGFEVQLPRRSRFGTITEHRTFTWYDSEEPGEITLLSTPLNKPGGNFVYKKEHGIWSTKDPKANQGAFMPDSLEARACDALVEAAKAKQQR